MGGLFARVELFTQSSARLFSRSSVTLKMRVHLYTRMLRARACVRRDGGLFSVFFSFNCKRQGIVEDVGEKDLFFGCLWDSCNASFKLV